MATCYQVYHRDASKEEKQYSILQREAVKTDPLVVAKLQFYVFVAGLMKPFLIKYQVSIKKISFQFIF